MSSFVPAGPAASGLRRAVGATVCATCGRANREDAAFCAGCGVRLASSCRSCGRALATDARFCDGCGAETAGPSDRAPAPDPLAPQSQASAWLDRLAGALRSGNRDAASSLAPTLVRRRRRLWSRSPAGAPPAAAELEAVLDGGVALESDLLATLGERQCLVRIRLTSPTSGDGAPGRERLYVGRVDVDGRTGTVESFAPVGAATAWGRLLELWGDELPAAARDRAARLRAGFAALGDPDAARSAACAGDAVLVDHRGSGAVTRGGEPAAAILRDLAEPGRGGATEPEVLALTERAMLRCWPSREGDRGTESGSVLAVRFDAEGTFDRIEVFAGDDIEEAWRAFERLDSGLEEVVPPVPDEVEVREPAPSTEDAALEALSALYEDDAEVAEDEVPAAPARTAEPAPSSEGDPLEALSSLYEDEDRPDEPHVVPDPVSVDADESQVVEHPEPPPTSEDDALEALSSLYEDDADAFEDDTVMDLLVDDVVLEDVLVDDMVLEDVVLEDVVLDDLDPEREDTSEDSDPRADVADLRIELEHRADDEPGEAAVLREEGAPSAVGWAVADNTAVRTMRAWSDRLLAGDSDAAILFLAPTHRSVDRRAASRGPALHPGVTSASVRTVATRGDRVALVQITIDEGEQVLAVLHAVGLDARGRILDEITLDDGDLEAAFDAIDEVLCSVRPDLGDRVAARRELTAALISRDLDRARACFAPEAVLVHHDERGTDAGLEGWLRRLAAVVEGCERLEVHVLEQLRSTVWGSVLRRVHRGRTVGGTDVESEAIVVLTTRDGLIARQEIFSVHDRDRALARFEELRPIRHVVTEALAAHNRRDLASLRSWFADDAVVTDHRRAAAWTDAGVDELLDVVKSQWPSLDAHVEVEFARVIGDVTLVRAQAAGAAHADERGASAWVIVLVDDSAIASVALFDHDQRADAEARFIDVVGQQRVL